MSTELLLITPNGLGSAHTPACPTPSPPLLQSTAIQCTLAVQCMTAIRALTSSPCRGRAQTATSPQGKGPPAAQSHSQTEKTPGGRVGVGGRRGRRGRRRGRGLQEMSTNGGRFLIKERRKAVPYGTITLEWCKRKIATDSHTDSSPRTSLSFLRRSCSHARIQPQTTYQACSAPPPLALSCSRQSQCALCS